MSNPQMLRDTNGGLISAFRPASNTSVATSATSQVVAIPSNTRLVRIAASVDVYIQFGNSGATATTNSMLLQAGSELFNVNESTITHVAVLQVGATAGVFSVTQML